MPRIELYQSRVASLVKAIAGWDKLRIRSRLYNRCLLRLLFHPVRALERRGNDEKFSGKNKFIVIIGILENAGDARGRMTKFVNYET